MSICLSFLLCHMAVPQYIGTGQAVKILSWPVPWQNIEIPSQQIRCQDLELVPLSLCPRTMNELLSRCPFVLGQ